MLQDSDHQLDSEGQSDKGAPIRAISRGLAVLKAINRGGSLSMMQIAQQSSVPYPTACRIVQTLLEEGMIEREPARKRYRPTALVQTLSLGYQAADRLVALARPHIVSLCNKVAWPISIASRTGNSMIVRDSTHQLTSLTLSNYFPGFTLPLLECSTGKCYLAFCPDEERETILSGMRKLQGSADKLAALLLHKGALIDDIRAKGYATQVRNLYTSTPGKTSSIAVPLFDGNRVVGSMALIFFASAMSMDEALRLYLEDLKATAQLIGDSLAMGESLTSG
jgi:IclR family transcriptional regulator, mhp operon transcriptional activator